MTAVAQTYRYPASSALSSVPGGQALSLASEVGDEGAARSYLRGFALYPDITARGLRAVSDLVSTRFYVPPGMLAKILREADPVATIGPGAVRFEGFSACCSTYVRLDLDDGALDASFRRPGTTNVDFGPELRGALAGVPRDSTLALSIGAEAVEIVRDGAAYLEKKVPLPLRWIKGFAEVQVALAGMEPAFDMPRVAAQRFLREAARGKSDHQQYVSLSGSVPRSTMRPTIGAVPLRGGHRLRVLEPLLGLAEALEVHVNRDTGASAWTLRLPQHRLCLVLSTEPWRGFSGDGGLLSRIAGSDGSDAATLRAQLNWQDRIDEGSLADATGLSAERVAAGLAELAALGLVGFDMARGGYFHRVLPFDLDKIADLNPRLKSARQLLETGAVSLTENGADVESDTVLHRVRQTDDGYSCTCPWYARHGQERGPCKHVLAMEMARETPT